MKKLLFCWMRKDADAASVDATWRISSSSLRMCARQDCFVFERPQVVFYCNFSCSRHVSKSANLIGRIVFDAARQTKKTNPRRFLKNDAFTRRCAHSHWRPLFSHEALNIGECVRALKVSVNDDPGTTVASTGNRSEIIRMWSVCGCLAAWLIVSERECVTQRLRSYLQQEVRGVVDEHHQGPDPDVVGAVRETQQEDGGEVMDNLFFEILKQIEWKRTRISVTGGPYW